MLKVLCAIDRTLSGDRSHSTKLPMPFYMMRSIAPYGRSIAPRHFYDRCLQLSAPKCGIYPLHFCSLRSIAHEHAIDRIKSCDRSRLRHFALCIIFRQVAIDRTLSGDRSHSAIFLCFYRAIDRTFWAIDRIVFLLYKNRKLRFISELSHLSSCENCLCESS